MKRIISFILTFCMLMSLTAAFAENDNEIENNENIIDTSLLTDENVLYKAIQEKNGFSLFGLGYRDNDEIIADFDVVMGFDMSYSMYEYDINGDKQWIDSFKSISEQAPEDTRYAVLSSNSEGFTDDLDKAISEVQEKEYTGTNDIISILDRTISVFDEESSNRNKVVLVTTHKVDDISALKDKMDELSDYGIIPFVFVLNTDTNNALNMDGIYQCPTDLDLRLSISDLYLAFCEFNMTEAAQTYANTIDYNVYRVLSDFRTDRHMFVGADNNAGLQMASMLNMYKCVPLKASIGIKNKSEYDLFNASSYSGNNIDLEDKLQSFVSGENAKFGEVPYDFQYVWNSIFGQISNNRKIIISNPDITQAATVLRKNMKRRFPMMMKHDDEWEIVYEYRNPIGGSLVRYNENKEIEFNKIQAVFDTYEYLMSTVGKATNLYEKVTRTNSEITVEIQYPSNYDFTIDNEQNDLNTIRREALDGKSGYIDFNSVDKTLYVTAQCTGENTERNFVVGSLVTFTNGLADIYGANKVYYTRYYRDITINDWFHDYIFKATNLGIVSGTDENKFEPNNTITLAQLFRMMFESAKVDGILTADDNPTTYWAYPYMKKASELGFKTIDDQDIDVSINKLDKLITIGETKVSRGEAAKYICQLFFDQRKEVNVPTLLYDKVENIENERKNAYKNFIDVSGNKNENYIYKLYMNNILNGQDKNTMAPDADIRRSEICTILIKCLFDMDENIPVIIANIEENTEAVPVDVYMTTDERIIKNISFNNNNKAAFNIHIEDDEEYEVAIDGGTEATIQGEMDCIEGTGTFTPETTQKGNFVYTIRGPGVFQLNLVRTGIDIINLKITNISTQSQVIPLNQVITQDMINRNKLSFTAEKNGCYIINVTPGTTFNLTDQAGRKVEEYYTELYRGFNSSVPEFITQKMRGVNRELNYIDSNGNKTSLTEECACYKYYLEKGTTITIDNISNNEYKLQVDEPQDGDIVFHQHENEGEYFIYSDAPEAITDNTLADYAPYAFIREEHLGKGKYTFMSWHLNYSSEDVTMDVQLYSENAKIKVNAIGINAPQIDRWDSDWTSPQAILNMEYFKYEKIFKVKTNEYDNRLYGRIDEGYYTLNSAEGNSVWLQDIYNKKIYNNGYNKNILEYPRLPKYNDDQMPFYIIFEFEVLEGEVVLNQMAYNNRENIMSIGENNAPYIGEGAFKGISNTPNEVISDFSYEIKGDEKYIPVRTFNLNNPLGYKSVFWESNVNPQQDATPNVNIPGIEDGNGNLYKYRVRDIATETELLKFRYVDNSKKDRYDYDTDDNVWYFDEFHDRNYSADSSIVGDVPNRLIATEAALNRYDGENERNKLPIANYSVIETYNIKLKNSTESTKTIEFILDSESCEFLYLENLHKKPVMLSKGSHTRAQVMYYIVLEPNQEIEYKMKTGLFTANDGSMRNCFKIYEGEKDYGEIVGQDGEKHPVHIVNNLHDYDDDWNYPRQ